MNSNALNVMLLTLLSVVGMAAAQAQTETAVNSSSQSATAISAEHFRVVWVQDTSAEGRDVLATGGKMRLMAFDSRDAAGERTLSDSAGYYCKPLLSPDGNEVIYSDHRTRQVFVVPFGGGEPRLLAAGFALDVWQEPDRETVWVYVAEWIGKPESFRLRSVRRIDLKFPTVVRPVWSASQISPDNFQLGGSGRYAAGEFPWPSGGIANLEEGTWEKRATGCWSSMAPDDSGVSWVFDGPHRNLQLFAPENSRGWTVSVSNAPGIDGHEAFHPRWSNDVRYFAMTGPYSEQGPVNAISGGGSGVEIHIGRFRDDLQGVQEWLQVTHNKAPDFFPDLWVEGGAARTIDPAVLQQKEQMVAATPLQRVEVAVRCLETIQIPSPQSILPYRRALVVNRYSVSEVISGELSDKQILVAHWAILEGRIQSVARIRRGQRLQLQLESYSEHRELAGERLIMEGDRDGRKIYLDVTNGIPDDVQ